MADLKSMRSPLLSALGCGTLLLAKAALFAPIARALPLTLAQAPTPAPTLPPPPATPAASPGSDLPPSPGGTFAPAQPGTFDFRQAPLPGAAPQPTPPDTAAAEPEVLVAEVLVTGTTDQELIDRLYSAIRTRAGQVTTRSQLQADIRAVFATGFFADVKALPSDTALGVRVTFEVKPNPVLRTVQTQGATVLDAKVLEETFAPQQGKVINFSELQAGVQAIERWYAEKGFVLAKVADVKSAEDGTVTLTITEGQIEDIRVKGNNNTREFIVTRELKAKPGDVFNRDQIQKDLQAVFGLNLFQDVNVSLDPGQDPNKVVVVVNVEEKRTGTLTGTIGVSSATGVFGGASISEDNLGGNNQRASANIQVGTTETLFDLGFTDPRIATLDIPTSYNVSIANRQSNSFVFNEAFALPNGDPVRINRLGGSVTFSRPIGDTWRANLGVEIQSVQARDSGGSSQRFDQLGNPITFNRSGTDNFTTLRLGLVNDTRNAQFGPTQGSVFRISADQSVRLLDNGLNSTRIETSYSQFIPINLLQNRTDRPEVLAFDIRAGTVLGDLAPYDAFAIGGGSGVRGFFEGGVGSGRSYAQASAEYRFPLFDPVGGVVFVDYANDLGSAGAVAGNPAAARRKPGSGLGLGAGLRIQSPLGPLRVDYGFGQGTGANQIHFAIDEKF